MDNFPTTMKQQVFAVCYDSDNGGQYSCREISAIFTTKELAEAYIKEKYNPTTSGLIKAGREFEFYIDELYIFGRMPTISEV